MYWLKRNNIDMNKFTSNILILLCVAMFWSCQTDNTTDIVSVGSVTQLTVSTPETRTSLGGKSEGTYPVYWSEEDCIVVNGVKSSKASIDSAILTGKF